MDDSFVRMTHHCAHSFRFLPSLLDLIFLSLYLICAAKLFENLFGTPLACQFGETVGMKSKCWGMLG